MRHPRPADEPAAVRLGTGRGKRQGHRHARRRRYRQPRTRRPARTLGCAAGKPAPDLRRNRPPSRTGQGYRRMLRGRFPRARHVAGQDPRRTAHHAQGALRHHAAPHAARRQPRPRHDAAHLHDPGQSRLCERGLHGQEVPHLAGAATARHRAVRQFALHRGQAQWFPVLPQPYLVGHRSAPHRHAAVRVRGRFRLRTLCRLYARRADVFRLPRRKISRRLRPQLPRFP